MNRSRQFLDWTKKHSWLALEHSVGSYGDGMTYKTFLTPSGRLLKVEIGAHFGVMSIREVTSI